MDAFTFMVALLLMMLAVQFNEKWLVFAIVAITILSLRSLKATALLLLAGTVLFVVRDFLQDYWPYIFFGLIILALVVGAKGKGEQPAYYNPDMYSGLMGGNEGY